MIKAYLEEFDWILIISNYVVGVGTVVHLLHAFVAVLSLGLGLFKSTCTILNIFQFKNFCLFFSAVFGSTEDLLFLIGVITSSGLLFLQP